MSVQHFLTTPCIHGLPWDRACPPCGRPATGAVEWRPLTFARVTAPAPRSPRGLGHRHLPEIASSNLARGAGTASNGRGTA
jgi:hypothetical protein